MRSPRPRRGADDRVSDFIHDNFRGLHLRPGRTFSKMSTINDGWIVRAEREPTDEELAAGVCLTVGAGPIVSYGRYAPYIRGSKWTHWRPHSLPDPPRAEETQLDRDKAAFCEWRKANLDQGTAYAWHSACAYARRDTLSRKEVAELIWECCQGGNFQEPWNTLVALAGADKED